MRARARPHRPRLVARDRARLRERPAHREVGRVDDREPAGQQRVVGPRAVVADRQRVQAAGRLLRGGRERREPGVGVALAVERDRCLPVAYRGNVPHREGAAGHAAARPARRARIAREDQGPPGILRVLPQVELVGVDVELVQQPRGTRVTPAADVVEAEVAPGRRIAVMQLVALAAVGVQDDQDVLRPPHAQLARGLAGRRVQRLVPDQLGIVGIVDVHHHDAAVRHALVAPVGPAADVRIVAVDRHAAAFMPRSMSGSCPTCLIEPNFGCFDLSAAAVAAARASAPQWLPAFCTSLPWTCRLRVVNRQRAQVRSPQRRAGLANSTPLSGGVYLRDRATPNRRGAPRNRGN